VAEKKYVAQCFPIDAEFLCHDICGRVTTIFYYGTLEKELETLKRELPNLLPNEGKYVVVAGDSIVGILASYEDALARGYAECGLKPFMMKRIQAIEQVQYFSRDSAWTCPIY
jgi:hypothetical protein